MEGLRERDGSGEGHILSRYAPRLSRKGALRAGSSINAPLRDNRGGGGGGGGGGLSRKCVLSSLLYQPFLLNCSNFGVEKIIERNLNLKEKKGRLYETFLFVQNK